VKTNPLKKLETLGQSVWLDYIRRDMLTSGQLKKLIEEDGVRGITSNPSIFQKAVTESADYDKAIEAMTNENATAIYEKITQADVRDASDIFRPLYNKLDGKDGYVSLEVNPHLAYDTEGTIAEARRLWKALDRPNVFIKVPATHEGLPAIKQLISEGININVTLLFGLPRYREVAEAYIAGLEARAVSGQPLEKIYSVASFFLSRIDSAIDPIVEESHRGQAAVALAKTAYQIYLAIIGSDRFKKLAQKGANPQRLLWASTSTKNPAYSDIKYVESLIGAETVNTLPMETLEAYRDQGEPALMLEQDVRKAAQFIEELGKIGVKLGAITQQLEKEGVDKFVQAYDQLIEALKKKII
jgi:transaldolase